MAPDFLPVLLEKDDEPDLVAVYGVVQFPTVIFTDAAGEPVEVVIHPESSADVLRALDFARRWLRGEVDVGE